MRTSSRRGSANRPQVASTSSTARAGSSGAQRLEAAAGRGGSGSPAAGCSGRPSASSTMTSWPPRASPAARLSPPSPAPATTTRTGPSMPASSERPRPGRGKVGTCRRRQGTRSCRCVGWSRRYGTAPSRRRHRPGHPAGRDLRPARAERRRQDHDGRDPRGLPQPRTPARSRCSATTRPRPTGPGGPGSAWSCSRTGEAGELTVAELVRHFAGFYPRPRDPEEVIDAVGLTEKAGTRAGALSGGQRRRLDVGLGHRRQPRAALPGRADHRVRPAGPPVVLGACSSRCAPGGTTMLLTTHYLDEAEHLADRVGVIAGGRLLDVDTVDRLGGAERRTPAGALARGRVGCARSAPTTRPRWCWRWPHGCGGAVPELEVRRPRPRGRLPVDARRGRRRRSRQATGRRAEVTRDDSRRAVARREALPALRFRGPGSSCCSSSGSARRWSSSSSSRS